jgi:hypothetical protein
MVQDDESLDLLHGIGEIAQFLKQSESRTGYQVRKKRWPVFYVGKLVYARKSELAAAASGQTPQVTEG